MRLREAFELMVRLGREVDPRGFDGTEAVLVRNRNLFKALPSEERRRFDLARLSNPFGDSRIVLGDPDVEVEGFMVGIDVSTDDLINFYRLRRDGWPVTVVLSHHTIGPTYMNVEDYNFVDPSVLSSLFGIKVEKAEEIAEKSNRLQLAWKERIVERAFVPRRDLMDLADALDIPLICVHTPADNHLLSYVHNLIERESPRLVKEFLEALKEVPEFKRGRREAYTVAKLEAGRGEGSELGNIFLALTNALALCCKNCMRDLAEAGVDTVIGVFSSRDIESAEGCGINLINMPHYPSDSLGLNLLLDRLLEVEPLEVLCCGGFWRFERST